MVGGRRIERDDLKEQLFDGTHSMSMLAKTKPTEPPIFNADVQRHILGCFLIDPEAYKQCRHIVKDEYFDDHLRNSVRFIQSHYNGHHSLPTATLIKARYNVDLEIPERDHTFERHWLLDAVQEFCRYKAVENAVLEGYERLQRGESEQIERQIVEGRKITLDASKSRFPRLTALDLDQQPMPEWLITGLLFERQIGMLYGKPASLKSFIALALASILAHGMKWQANNLRRRRVIYVAGEGASMMPMRRKAWFKFHDIPIADDGLDIVPVAVPLLDSTAVSTFIDEMQRDNDNIGLVIFDTLSTCAAGKNEDSAEIASLAIENGKAIARALDCAGLFIHHPGKDEGRGARGSSVFLANVDMMARVERHNDTAKVIVEKQKDERCQTMHFKAHLQELDIRDGDGNIRSSLVLTETTPELPGSLLSEDESDRLTIAGLLKPNIKYSLNEAASLIRVTMGIGQTTCKERIKKAIPEGPSGVLARSGTGFMRVTRQSGERQGKSATQYVQVVPVDTELDNDGVTDLLAEWVPDLSADLM
jgi:hypothetical protein